jgi:predicted nucleic acid-binding protein
MEEVPGLVVISDTGPLISIFQSDSMDVVAALLGGIHTSTTCHTEMLSHGLEDFVVQAVHALSSSEAAQAVEIAQRIALHPKVKHAEPANHIGEAEVMTLVQRAEFDDGVLLLDELAARQVAFELQLPVSGFAGVLLMGVSEGLLTPQEVKTRLEPILFK